MLTSLVQQLASAVLIQPQARLNNRAHTSNRDKEYYLQDVIFQVEGQLFKVNRHLFVWLSPVFRDMFEGSEPDGSSDDHPLVLEDIKKKDFIRLLKCLYPLKFQGTSDYAVFSLEEWQSVLELSSLYEMTEVKAFAIEKMTPLLTESPSLQIHLAKAYDIRKWLVPGLLGLAQRDKALDEEDVNFVGLSDALKICALRERKRRCETCASCSRGVHSGGFDLEDIRRAFDICDTDLLSSLPQFEHICTCPPSPRPPQPPHHHSRPPTPTPAALPSEFKWSSHKPPSKDDRRQYREILPSEVAWPGEKASSFNKANLKITASILLYIPSLLLQRGEYTWRAGNRDMSPHHITSL